MLQWGRGFLAAESGAVVSSPDAVLALLQWGRGFLAAERAAGES